MFLWRMVWWIGSVIVILNSAVALAKQPNIVLILVDDLGKNDLSCEGSTFYETPNIDNIAKTSMRFVNGYSACQVCSPSCASIQTGKVPTRVQITDYISPSGGNQPEQWKRNTRLLPAPFEKQLALDEVTIAESLKELGYSTYFAGKWHLGGQGFSPNDQGYDINVGGFEFGSPPGGFFAPYRNPKLTDGPPGEQLPLRLGRETADFVRAQQKNDQPFFAMLSFYSVHAPIQSTQELWQKYREKAVELGLAVDRQRFIYDRTQEVRQVQDHPVYAGMMESLDDAVGMVLDALEQTDQSDETVVVFTSDNGGVSSGDGYATSCLPMRGGKGRQWEGGIRQPYYIRWPGVADDGRETTAFASGTDFLPTLVEIAGGKVADSELDGRSLVPVLQGKTPVDRTLWWHYPHYGNQGGEPSGIIRSGDWKLIYYYEDERSELYNLAEDPGEQNDRAIEFPAHTAQLLDELKEKLNETHAIMPSKNPNFDLVKHEATEKRRRTIGMKARELEHAGFLKADFTPRGGWWQDRGK